MDYLSRLSAILIGAVTLVTLPSHQAFSLESQTISQQAQQYTVRIDGEETGTGIIIGRNGDTYTVLTCWHVVDTPGKYQITTPDNLQYGIDYRQIKTQAEIDLAVLQFTSNQNYSVAQFGDSTQITPGTTIHITGYPDPFPGLPERSYYYASAEVNTVLTTGDKGYTIVHDNPGSPGTSGGAILDENGLLIGINGKITSDGNIGKAFGLAIPLQLYLDQKNSLSIPTRVIPPQDFVSLAEKKLKAGDYQGAIDYFNQALANDSNNLEVYYGRAKAYSRLKNYQAAIKDLNRLIELNPHYAQAYHRRGMIYNQLNNYQQALTDFNQAIALNPEDAQVYHSRAVVYNQLNNYQQALIDFNQAIKLNPTNCQFYTNRGTLYYELNNYQQALTDFNQAIQINSQNTQARINRGIIYNQLNNYQQALIDFNQAIKLDPTSAIAYYNRGVTYSNLEDYNKALADFDQALVLNPQLNQVYCVRGSIYYLLEDEAKSRADLEQCR